MKKSILLAITIAGFALSAKAQKVGEMRLSDIRSEYLELLPVSTVFSSKITFRIDYGQNPTTMSQGDYLRNDNGKKIEFNSPMDCLNTLKNYGYTLAQVYTEQSDGNTSQTKYILKRM